MRRDRLVIRENGTSFDGDGNSDDDYIVSQRDSNDPVLLTDYTRDTAEDEDDDEFVDDSVEEFIAHQKRKYAFNPSSSSSSNDPTLKRHRPSLSFDSESFDRVYRELLAQPSSCSCSQVPEIPEDRRPRKDRLRVASFNAEWLFLFGGSGSVDCPGRGCPWEVSNDC